MDIKKIIIILVLLLMSVTAVSASDVDNSTDQKCDVQLMDYSDDFVGSSNEDIVLDESLNDLQGIVDRVDEGGTLNLSTDYSGGNRVTISKSMTIDGNNHVLDADRKDCIFSLTDGVNVVLKNIVFKNGYLDNGGAISNYYESSSLTLINCTFLSNHAKLSGGGIYTIGNLNIDGCTFSSNVVDDNDDGAIYAIGKTNIIKNSVFSDNKVVGSIRNVCNGGAIYAENLEQLSNSQFIENYVETDDGGAIYINGNCDPNIVSCLFSHNSCGDEGGAIYLDSVYSNLKISYCVFVGNQAGDKGQAVYNCGDYDCVDYCWYGTNNPNFSDMFKIYHRLGSDDDYGVSNYAKINLKVNDTNLFVGNKYQLSVYFTSNTESKLNGEIIGCDASFSGDGSFSNKKNGYNEITTDVVFTKEYPIVLAIIDQQSVYLSPDVINKYPSAVNILSCDDVIWPGSVKVNFGIINRNKASFEIKDNQGKIVKQGDIGDDEKSLVIAGLDPGSYSITISNSESFDRLPSSATSNFKVKPLYNVAVSANDVVYGEITTITLKSDIDALFNVTVDKYGLIQMEVINGTATHQLKLNSGVYTTHTVIDDDNCAIKCTEASFVVHSIGVRVSLVVNDTFAYPNNITGEIITNHPGAYVIKDSYNYVLATVNITNKSAEFNAGVLRPGFHYIYVFINEPNYDGAASAGIEVVRGNLEGYSLHIPDIVYSNDLIAESHSSMENHFVIEIGDYTKPIYIRESGLFVNLGSNWDAGVYNAKLVFKGDEFYLPSSYSTQFTVYKADSDLNLNVKALSSDEGIEICHTLPSKATGDIEYYLNGTLIDTLSVDRNLKLPSLDLGHYVLVAKYCGDKNYNSSCGTIELDVNSQYDINSTHEAKDDELVNSSTELNKEIPNNLDNNYSSDDAGEVVVSNTKDLTDNSKSDSPVKSIGSNFNFLWLLLVVLLIAGFAVSIKKYNK